MNFADAVKSGFNNYVTFSGRAARSEFWFWTLFSILANLAAGIVDMVLGIGLVGVVVSLALLLPGLAVSARRLHNIDRTGWWLLISLTIIGVILLIVWACPARHTRRQPLWTRSTDCYPALIDLIGNPGEVDIPKQRKLNPDACNCCECLTPNMCRHTWCGGGMASGLL